MSSCSRHGTDWFCVVRDLYRTLFACRFGTLYALHVLGSCRFTTVPTRCRSSLREVLRGVDRDPASFRASRRSQARPVDVVQGLNATRATRTSLTSLCRNKEPHSLNPDTVRNGALGQLALFTVTRLQADRLHRHRLLRPCCIIKLGKSRSPPTSSSRSAKRPGTSSVIFEAVTHT